MAVRLTKGGLQSYAPELQNNVVINKIKSSGSGRNRGSPSPQSQSSLSNPTPSASELYGTAEQKQAQLDAFNKGGQAEFERLKLQQIQNEQRQQQESQRQAESQRQYENILRARTVLQQQQAQSKTIQSVDVKTKQPLEITTIKRGSESVVEVRNKDTGEVSYQRYGVKGSGSIKDLGSVRFYEPKQEVKPLNQDGSILPGFSSNPEILNANLGQWNLQQSYNNINRENALEVARKNAEKNQQANNYKTQNPIFTALSQVPFISSAVTKDLSSQKNTGNNEQNAKVTDSNNNGDNSFGFFRGINDYRDIPDILSINRGYISGGDILFNRETQQKVTEGILKSGKVALGIAGQYLGTSFDKPMYASTRQELIKNPLNPVTQYKVYTESKEITQGIENQNKVIESYTSNENLYKSGLINEQQYSLSKSLLSNQINNLKDYSDIKTARQIISESNASPSTRLGINFAITGVQTLPYFNPTGRVILGGDMSIEGLENKNYLQAGLGVFTAGSGVIKLPSSKITGSQSSLKTYKVVSGASSVALGTTFSVMQGASTYQQTGDIYSAVGSGLGGVSITAGALTGKAVYNKAYDIYRTRGMKEIPASNVISQEVLSFYEGNGGKQFPYYEGTTTPEAYFYSSKFKLPQGENIKLRLSPSDYLGKQIKEGKINFDLLNEEGVHGSYSHIDNTLSLNEELFLAVKDKNYFNKIAKANPNINPLELKQKIDFQFQSTIAHELIHYKTPQFILKNDMWLPYRLQPSEILAFGLEKHYAKTGFKTNVLIDELTKGKAFGFSATSQEWNTNLINPETGQYYSGKGISAGFLRLSNAGNSLEVGGKQSSAKPIVYAGYFDAVKRNPVLGEVKIPNPYGGGKDVKKYLFTELTGEGIANIPINIKTDQPFKQEVEAVVFGERVPIATRFYFKFGGRRVPIEEQVFKSSLNNNQLNSLSNIKSIDYTQYSSLPDINKISYPVSSGQISSVLSSLSNYKTTTSSPQIISYPNGLSQVISPVKSNIGYNTSPSSKITIKSSVLRPSSSGRKISNVSQISSATQLNSQSNLYNNNKKSTSNMYSNIYSFRNTKSPQNTIVSNKRNSYLPKYKPYVKKSFGLFTVSLRRAGLFKPVAKARSYNEAINLGKLYTENTLGASFKISGNGIRTAKLPGGFYRSKKEKGVFIEKNYRRLNTRKEIGEIQTAKLNSLYNF